MMRYAGKGPRKKISKKVMMDLKERQGWKMSVNPLSSLSSSKKTVVYFTNPDDLLGNKKCHESKKKTKYMDAGLKSLLIK